MGYYAAGGPQMMPSHGPDPALARPSSGGPIDDGGRSYRRTNPMNVKAARRAIRRLTSFEKIARKVISFTSARPVHKGHFKRGRRAR